MMIGDGGVQRWCTRQTWKLPNSSNMNFKAILKGRETHKERHSCHAWNLRKVFKTSMPKINSNWVLSEVSYGAKYCNPKKNLEQHIFCVCKTCFFRQEIATFWDIKIRKKEKDKTLPLIHIHFQHIGCIYIPCTTPLYILQPNQLALPTYSMWILIKGKLKKQKWPSWACGVKGIFYMCILDNHFASTFLEESLLFGELWTTTCEENQTNLFKTIKMMIWQVNWN